MENSVNISQALQAKETVLNAMDKAINELKDFIAFQEQHENYFVLVGGWFFAEIDENNFVVLSHQHIPKTYKYDTALKIAAVQCYNAKKEPVKSEIMLSTHWAKKELAAKEEIVKTIRG